MRAQDGKSDDDHTMSASHQSTVVSHTASHITSFTAPPISHTDYIVHGKTTIDIPPDRTISPSYVPLIVPPGPIVTEPTVPPLEEFRLLKSPLADVAGVCNHGNCSLSSLRKNSIALSDVANPSTCRRVRVDRMTRDIPLGTSSNGCSVDLIMTMGSLGGLGLDPHVVVHEGS
jgi:hypothetical protein